jgi:peroxiredoxin
MSLEIGQKIPALELHVKDAEGIDVFDTGTALAGKKIIFFSVPGAFTPTCSAKHVPSYLANYDALKAAGFDEIICMAMNDVHVMYAWGQSQDVGDKITMLADREGQLSDALGLSVHMGPVLGTRASRSAFIVEDGVITKAFLEEPAVYEVSSAEHVLANL